MKIFVCIALSFLFFASCSKYYDAVITEKSGLKIREKPNVKSKKIGYIPFGSKIIVLKDSGPEEIHYGIKSKWFKIKYNEKIGWSFGGFIRILKSSNIIPQKFMNLKLKSYNFGGVCASEPDIQRYKLQLNNGKVKYIMSADEMHTHIDEISTGEYSVKGNEIIIKINYGAKKVIEPDEKITKSISKPSIFSIYWNKDINGFLTEYGKKVYNKNNYIVNNKDCYILTKEDFRKFKLCKDDPSKLKENDAMSKIGYFCKTK
ncbi:SH3 domain-containing protein [Spirochaetota bacterium]